MKRLTVRDEEKGYIWSPYSTTDIANKLADYEDAEEQGLLHIAPLKDGTSIWYIIKTIDGETLLIDGSYLFGVTEYEVGELGKDYFLTKEEAEKKLASMQKGE